MKFSSFGLMAGLAVSALAEDLLFVDVFEYEEYNEAITTLGMTAKVVTETDWRAMTTADFASYKAIVLADPSCSSDPTILEFLVDTKDVWGPAVEGNMVLIGTDPSYHFSSEPGAGALIDNAIKFSAAGKSSTGVSQTGLYFALSCYYDSVDTATVDTLSYFGTFGVRGNLDCYNKAHIVASSPALGGLADADLSDWSCSVHEAFSVYPSVGVNGFQALAIAQDIIGDGSQTFGDGTIGLPYIISRGATPAGCGNGKWESAFGEECDDGSSNGTPGDACSLSCKCLSGRPKGDGTCLPSLSNTTSSSSSYSPSPTRYANSTVITTATVVETTTFCPAPYVTPTVPDKTIIGVEIIVIIEIIVDCTTSGEITSESPFLPTVCTAANIMQSPQPPRPPALRCTNPSSPHPVPDTHATSANSQKKVTPAPHPPSSPPHHVHEQESTYVFTPSTSVATVTSKTAAASVSVTAKASGTVVPFTGGAGRQEVGFGVAAAVAGVVAFAL
ncbi:related to glucan 1,4-alpha-glucosidase [Phialocephala subalpina]|uniref:Related to glucan 1,4-alpha-glucosidase n=1 Tax=Phialocephala subalpina TaxID=576137 RepID=A0A1L7XQX9_9HELO|nr:related to glucan 1,4-alpha-glucosidase [Phialocephala subalpina]